MTEINEKGSVLAGDLNDMAWDEGFDNGRGIGSSDANSTKAKQAIVAYIAELEAKVETAESDDSVHAKLDRIINMLRGGSGEV